MKANLIAFFLALSSAPLCPAQQKSLSLERAIALARSNRASIAAAQLRLTSSRLSRRSLGASPATRLFVGYSFTTAIDDREDDLALAQPLDIFGRTAAARALGDASVHRAEAELQRTLAEIQFDVIEQYSEAASAHALAQSARQTHQISQGLHDAIKTLVEEGKAPGVQLTRVSIELERSRLMLSQRLAEERASVQRLSGLLNIPHEQVGIVEFAEIPVQTSESPQLPRRRADLMLLAAEVASADAEARIASLSSRPDLELQARRTPWKERADRYGLRLQLSFPIHDFGKARSEAAAARTRAEAARKALADAMRLAESELAAANIELTAAREQIERYQAIVESARSLVEKSRIGFAEKAITLVEMLEATRALREVEEGLVAARLRLARAQARYLRASGRILEVGP